MSVQPPSILAPARDAWDGTPPDDDTFFHDPHGWARLMATRQDLYRRAESCWVLRHELVEQLFTHPDTRQFVTEFLEFNGVVDGPVHDWFGKIVLTANGERHTRLRMPLAKSFAFPVMGQMRPRIRQIASDLLDELAGAGEFDFIDRVSAELPVRAICDVLGVPQADVPLFKVWADNLGRAFGQIPPEAVPVVNDAVLKLSDYARTLVAERRRAPQDDFITHLTQVADESGAYSEEELVSQVLGLIFAGSDTTRTALAIALMLLLQHRDEWNKLIADRTLLKNAVEESLRYEPTIGGLPRITTAEIDLGEAGTLPKGHFTVLSFTASQRDPRRFADPDRFDIARTDIGRGLVTFGGGPHRCLGEALARTEMEECLDLLAGRMPQITLTGPVPQFQALASGIRKLDHLQVRI